jgi:outer membrane protein
MRIRVVMCALLLVIAGRLEAQPRKISLSNSIQAALENNANVQIAEEQEVQAAARAQEQRAAIFPNVNGTAGYVNQTINLGARGIRFPGLPIPTTVGPFGTFDIRAQYTQPIVDFSLIRRYQSTRRAADASRFDIDAAKNAVAAMIARLYFNVQRARAMVLSIEAQIALDQNILKLARDRQEFGVGTGLDVTRAQSRLAVDDHRLLQARNDSRTAELRLLRAMGQRPNAELDLTDALIESNLVIENADAAVAKAFANRPEMKAEEKKLEAARLSVGGSKAERFPAVQAFADYGSNGNTDLFVPTNTIGVQVQLPIFDGGRRSAHRKTAESQLHQAEIRARDLRDEIELEVRLAIDTLASTREQLRAAEQSQKLALEELELARLRFDAQVAPQIEVVNAQAALAEARSRHVNALFALKSAEIEYQRVTGVEIR